MPRSLFGGLIALLLFATPPAHGADWMERSYGEFSFRFKPVDAKLVRYLGTRTQEIEERIRDELGLPGLGPLEVIVASTHEEFAALQPPGRGVGRWAAALAEPSRGRILLKSPRILVGGQPAYDRILVHEVAHIALERAMERERQGEATATPAPDRPGSPASVPRWLHEGYAMHVAREWSPSREVLLTRAVLAGRVIPLGRLVANFPEDEEEARVAYAQSVDLVHYMMRTYGTHAFRRFIETLGRGERFGGAIREAYGVDFAQLEREWRRHLQRRYTWVPLLASTGTLWFLASLVFLGAYIRKRFEARAKLAAWSREDPDA